MSIQPCEFYHQWGWQDQALSVEMLESGDASGVIMSPRHLDRHQLERYAQQLEELGTPFLVDPQCYDPEYVHDAEYPLGLDGCGITAILESSDLQHAISPMLEFQATLGVAEFILPGICVETVNQGWLRSLHHIAAGGAEWRRQHGYHDTPMLSTVAVAAGAIADQEHRVALLNSVVALPVDGIYLVIEGMDLQPEDHSRLFAVMDVAFRLHQNEKIVVLGYSSYWACLPLVVGLDRFASGGFENRRRFSSAEWAVDEEADDEGHPQSPRPRFWSLASLGRLRYPDELELLYEEGLWPPRGAGSPYAQVLLGGQSPAEVEWRRRSSFQHYLHTCGELASELAGLSFEGRLNSVTNRLRAAIALQDQWEGHGVVLPPESSGKHLEHWLFALQAYVDQHIGDIEEEFG